MIATHAATNAFQGPWSAGLAMLPEAERDIALLDDLMDSLVETGIEVVPNTPSEPSIAEDDIATPDLNGSFPDDEDDEFALLDIEVDTMENVHGTVRFADILQRQSSHFSLPCVP